MFPIPMRGNEEKSTRFSMMYLGFPIPMRGNEIMLPVRGRTAAVNVPNPHEG